MNLGWTLRVKLCCFSIVLQLDLNETGVGSASKFSLFSLRVKMPCFSIVLRLALNEFGVDSKTFLFSSDSESELGE